VRSEAILTGVTQRVKSLILHFARCVPEIQSRSDESGFGTSPDPTLGDQADAVSPQGAGRSGPARKLAPGG